MFESVQGPKMIHEIGLNKPKPTAIGFNYTSILTCSTVFTLLFVIFSIICVD